MTTAVLFDHRRALAVAGLAALVVALAAAHRPTEAPRALAPAQAAALVAATSGEAAGEVRAVGLDAQRINAAMPFAGGPVQPARAFVIPASGSLDHRRALLCLTQAVYYEAGFEPLEGRRAVAQVVLNRARHPAFPKSVCGVVYQRNSTPVCQFSFVCDGSLDRRPEPGAWRAAERIAAAALAGAVEQSVGSATHYHADYVAPRWAPMLAKIHKVGAHIFYRWPGSWGLPGAFTGRYAGEPNDPAALRPAVLRRNEGPEDEVLADAPVAGPISDGTVLKRAPNDVGGLLDTSKGWTLNIPLPGETGSAARAVAERQSANPKPGASAQYGAVAPTPLVAAR